MDADPLRPRADRRTRTWTCRGTPGTRRGLPGPPCPARCRSGADPPNRTRSRTAGPARPHHRRRHRRWSAMAGVQAGGTAGRRGRMLASSTGRAGVLRFRTLARPHQWSRRTRRSRRSRRSRTSCPPTCPRRRMQSRSCRQRWIRRWWAWPSSRPSSWSWHPWSRLPWCHHHHHHRRHRRAQDRA